MPANTKIDEMKKNKKHNAIVGDIPTMMVDLIDEVSDLRTEYDNLVASIAALRGRVKSLEDKPK